VEAFSSPDALNDKTCGGTQPYDDDNAYNDSHNDGTGMSPRYGLSAEDPPSWQQPGTNPGPMQLWYAMIYPLINMRFKGAIWYQGEANDGDPTGYCCRFPAMIADWRKKMDLALPFFWVQLAPPGPGCNDEPTCTNNNTGYALIRQGQQCALKLPATGYAVALDLGDPSSPFSSIHPRRKQEVGRRLMLAANAVVYNASATQQTYGPAIDKVAAASSLVGGALTVSYTAGTAAGLHAAGCAMCATVNSKVSVITHSLSLSLSLFVPSPADLGSLSHHLLHSSAAKSRHSKYRWMDLRGSEHR
jgi:hypothetical protein